MVAIGRANPRISGVAEHPTLTLAAKVEEAAAARATGEDRVVEFGRYRLVRSIGRGGMGQVFEAWDTQLQRHVALKLVFRGDQRATIEEARCLARLAHPNVVSVHEVGCVDGWGYIVMELVDGPNLRRWLCVGDDGEREWSEVVEVILAAARGLAAVHDAGLLHGDVKPGNVLIGRDGRVRVADFGLARIDFGLARIDSPGALGGELGDELDGKLGAGADELEELVRCALDAVDQDLEIDHDGVSLADSLGDAPFSSSVSGERRLSDELSETAIDELRALLASRPGDALRGPVGGTVPYMAPERLAGGVGGPAADQYSLCVTAWEALFDAIPGVLDDGAIERVMQRRRCPAAIVAVLRRGLEPCPDDRWPSMTALCSALDRARERPPRAGGRVRSLAFAAALTSSTFSIVTGLVGLLNSGADADASALECEIATKAVRARWGQEQHATLERHFAASDLALPRSEARFVIDRLDRWVTDWSSVWTRACVAEPDVRRCLEQERARFDAVLALLGSTAPDGTAGAKLGRDAAGAARALVIELGSPLGCLDSTRGPSLDVDGMGRLAELSAVERRIELAVLAGAVDRAGEQLESFDAMLAGLEGSAGASELALRRLAVEPFRARVLASTGDVALARDQLRLGVREAEARGHDGLRFALLLEAARLDLVSRDVGPADSSSLDDLAVLDGLAERVEPGPVARAELALVHASVARERDPRVLAAELEAAATDLSWPGQAHRYSVLRFELALRRAELHFAAGELAAASHAANQAWQISRDTFDLTSARGRDRWTPQVIAALRLAGASAALRGDCDGVPPIVEALAKAKHSQLNPTVQLGIRGTVRDPTAVNWASVRRACPKFGHDLQRLVE